MNICIIGDGLTSLSLAKNLINKKINVHIYKRKNIIKVSQDRTIGITKNNLDYIKSDIFDFPKTNFWKIEKIEICSEKLKNNKILNFQKKESDLFYMVKNDQFYKSLDTKLMKSKFFKRIFIKKDNFYQALLKDKKYDLIINCDSSNSISKKYFSKKIDKDYSNLAYTTTLKHEKLVNNTAVQIFTKFGPIAFLPISNIKTSVVYSMESTNKKYNDDEVLDLIRKYNPKFKIKKIFKLNNFQLKSSNLRNYYYKNILAFGDLLHKIHPLAGQGFNMTIRDIKILSEIVQNKIDLGIQLDSSIFEEFEKKTKHINFIFSNGIDFIYEFFNFDKKNEDKNISKIIQFFGKNKNLTNTLIKLADNGLNI
jgi:2-octaprenyl-6-methoxyphenol hydroxylase